MRESVSLREQLFQLILMNDHVVSCVKKLTGLIGSTGSFAIISLLVSSPIASVLQCFYTSRLGYCMYHRYRRLSATVSPSSVYRFKIINYMPKRSSCLMTSHQILKILSQPSYSGVFDQFVIVICFFCAKCHTFVCNAPLDVNLTYLNRLVQFVNSRGS